ncbi:nuclear pore complex protein NUP50A-like [Nymphaea colorata]|uniref:RanBD1 domain-containing protein n=1 Tax=Nymphaea colorata TaxID=210225 RepID=A0A5K0VXF7_9MAGN|nr:nuclear pore complex protein NUP50A-like [Nymphaea colorata]XP_031477393.1 nuclear pore complex protein NUP50A-like [Nymphaea colorata]
MGDGYSLSSKKRVAGREISRDDPGLDANNDVPEEEMGTFKRATDEVLATRRIVKVRRNQPSSAVSSNPFAAVRLVLQPTDAPAEGNTDSAAKTSDAPTVANALHDEVIPKESCGGTSGPEKTDEDEVTSEPSANLVFDNEGIERHSEGTLGDSAKETNGTNEAVDKSKTETDEPAKGVGEVLKDDSAQDLTEPGATNKTEAAVLNEKAMSSEGEANSGGTRTESAPLNSFQQLSGSRNAFTGLAGSGFSNPSFSFGTLPKTDCSFSFSTSGFGSCSGSTFSLKGSSTSLPLFGTGSSNNGSSSPLGLGSSSTEVNKSSGNALLVMQEVPVETGEENEKAFFVADASLYEFLDGGWKERGKGELKLNIATDGIGKPRLIMRTKGNYRLILNASLYPDMKLTNMEKKGITFSCFNSSVERRNTLSTFALKFKESATVDAFQTAVMDHTEETASLETPESSPKASDD